MDPQLDSAQVLSRGGGCSWCWGGGRSDLGGSSAHTAQEVGVSIQSQPSVLEDVPRLAPKERSAGVGGGG